MMGSPEMLMASAGHFIHKDVLVASRLADELGAEPRLLATVLAPLLEARET